MNSKQQLKKRIAWCYRSNGSREAIADYFTAQVAPRLSSRLEVTVFKGDLSGLEKEHRQQPFDVLFEQIEDDPRLRSIASRALPENIPDNIVQLRHIYPKAAAANSDRSNVKVLFSSRRDCSQWNIQHPSALSYYLPYPAVAPNEIDRLVGKKNLQVAYCGGVQNEYRAHVILEALSESDANPKLIWLIDREELDAAQSLCKEFGCSNVEFEIGRTARKWQEIIGMSQLALHTLYSAHRNPGPFLYISLISGVPVVVNNISDGALIPDRLAHKIDAGLEEVGQLSSLLSQLDSYNGLKLSESENIRSDLLRLHHPANVAAELEHVLVQAAGSPCRGPVT